MVWLTPVSRWATRLWPVVLVLLVGLVGTGPASEDQLEWSLEPDLLAYALVVLAALPLAVRRRWPAATVAASGGAVVVYLVAGYAYGPILFAVSVAVYGFADTSPLRRTLLWTGGLWVAVSVAGSLRLGPDQLTPHGAGWLAGSLAFVAIPTAAGAAVRIGCESEAGVRAEQARRAVSEERLRTAQQLHDSVGHGLAVIAMQAGVALHVLDRDPPRVRATLEAIRDASRESLDSLRAELEVLRRPAEGESPPRRPDPGLADVDVLLSRVRGGGIEVAADVAVRETDVPPAVGAAVYRVLQESLTNVLRHANATAVDVRVRRDAGHLDVVVRDDGVAATGRGATAESAAPTPSGSGSGIPAMRRRVEGLGGQFRAAARPEGGFVVQARLPLSPRVRGGRVG